MRKYWIEQEEELLKKVWNSPNYSREDLMEMFDRTWRSLEIKAGRLGLMKRWQVEELIRVKSIEEALKADHVI